MMRDLTDQERKELIPEDENLVRVVLYDSGRTAAIMPFMFTWAIITDLSAIGYEDRWCYHELVDALGALEDWNGQGEPEGWHRHPLSGRRRDEAGNELGAW